MYMTKPGRAEPFVDNHSSRIAGLPPDQNFPPPNRLDRLVRHHTFQRPTSGLKIQHYPCWRVIARVFLSARPSVNAAVHEPV